MSQCNCCVGCTEQTIHVTLEQALKPQKGSRVRYSSTLFFIHGARWGQWLTPRPGRFTPERDPYPFHRRLGGLQCRSGRAEHVRNTGLDPRTVQLVAGRYTY